MLCDICNQNPATVHSIVLKNGQKSEIHMCQSCHQSIGAQGISPGFLSYLVSGSVSPKRICGCQTTFEEFQRTGKAGCEHCYETFDRQINNMIQRIHSAQVHTGRIPENTIVHHDPLLELKKQLEASIKEERFEDAAKLRDEIRSIESEGDSI